MQVVARAARVVARPLLLREARVQERSRVQAVGSGMGLRLHQLCFQVGQSADEDANSYVAGIQRHGAILNGDCQRKRHVGSRAPWC